MSSQPIAALLMSDPGRAAEVASGLTQEGIAAVVLGTSDEFHRILNHQRVDLVLVEHELPGFLTGLELLERLYQDLLRPAAVLQGRLSPELQARAGKIGVDRVMRAGEDLPTLMAAVRALLESRRTAQCVLIPPGARRLIQRSGSIRPLPQLLVKLCGALDYETVPIEQVAQDISVDPRVTAELLKLVNSTAMGVRREITQVSEAVKFLGVRRTIALVLSATLIDIQSGLAKSLPDQFRAWYHHRSVLIASTATSFARHFNDVSPESASILGLLQDLGMLVMAQACGEKYLRAVNRVREVAHLRLEATEREDWGMTHADVTAALLRQWELPQSMVAMVLNHHEPLSECGLSPTELRFLHAMQIGEAVANLTDNSTPPRSRLLNQLLAGYGRNRSADCKTCLAEAVARAAEQSRLFSIPEPDEQELRGMLHEALTAPADREPTLLLVAQDPQLSDRIRTIVADHGWSVLDCAGLSDAKQLALWSRAVVCDVYVGPRTGPKHGLEIVRGLRAAGIATPILMVGGDRARDAVLECIASGITDYLPEPFDETLLVKKLVRHAGLPAAAPAVEATA